MLAASRDRLLIAPGTYREGSLNPPNIAVTPYATGTVSVTNGSAVVTGSGTTFGSSNVVAGDVFQVAQIAHGTDGVTNGTSTFTSAAGNFQAGMVGMTIRIGTKAAFVISAVASATSITITDTAGTAGAPTAGSSLTYDVGPESPYYVASQDSNTQLTLSTPWSGPTLTGLAYSCWGPVFIIGDEGGTLTDGVGGEVRLTGSDNDQTVTRANVFVTGRSYNVYRGLHMDMVSTACMNFTAGTNNIIEQCAIRNALNGIQWTGTALTNHTVRQCVIQAVQATAVNFTAVSTVDNAANLVENVRFLDTPNASGVQITRIGGVLCRNLTITGTNAAVRMITASPAAGQAATVNNCLIVVNGNGIVALATTDFLENRNTFSNNGTARSNTTVGANSVTYPDLSALPLLTLGLMTEIPLYPSSFSQTAALTGLNPPAVDLYGIARANPSSYGDAQYTAGQRPADSGTSRNRRGGD